MRLNRQDKVLEVYSEDLSDVQELLVEVEATIQNQPFASNVQAVHSGLSLNVQILAGSSPAAPLPEQIDLTEPPLELLQ